MTPAYEIRAVGNKNRQKFMCEVLKNTIYLYAFICYRLKECLFGKAEQLQVRKNYFDLTVYQKNYSDAPKTTLVLVSSEDKYLQC